MIFFLKACTNLQYDISTNVYPAVSHRAAASGIQLIQYVIEEHKNTLIITETNLYPAISHRVAASGIQLLQSLIEDHKMLQ